VTYGLKKIELHFLKEEEWFLLFSKEGFLKVYWENEEE